MKVILFSLVPHGSGELRAGPITTHDRLSVEQFKYIHSGRPASTFEKTFNFIPDGFVLWLKRNGEYCGIQE